MEGDVALLAVSLCCCGFPIRGAGHLWAKPLLGVTWPDPGLASGGLWDLSLELDPALLPTHPAWQQETWSGAT